MQANIKQLIPVPEIPSASGIEVFENYIYIVGDDSPYLFKLNFNFEIVTRYLLFDSKEIVNGRIPKAIKPDIELMSIIFIEQKPYLLMMGSGSTVQRETAFVFDFATESIKSYYLRDFYKHIKNQIGNSLYNNELNLEALAVNDNHVWLFQRGNVAAENVALKYNLVDFSNFIFQSSSDIKTTPNIYLFNEPRFEDFLAGFSGACHIPDSNLLLYTASVENTANAIDDGEVLGSFVGIFNNDDVSQNKAVLLHQNQQIFRGKVESVSYWQKTGNSSFTAIAVTDNDGQTSEILVLEVIL